MRDVQGPQIDKQTTGAQIDVQMEAPKLNCYTKHGKGESTYVGGKYANNVNHKGRGLSKSGAPVSAGHYFYIARV
jgi:hypothetical protein